MPLTSLEQVTLRSQVYHSTTMHGSRNFQFRGEGTEWEGPGPTEKCSDHVFFSPQLIFRGSPMVYFKQNYIFPSFPPWIQHFPGGLTFSRAVQLPIPMETYRTCYFSEGGGCPDPLPRTPPPPPSGSVHESTALLNF